MLFISLFNLNNTLTRCKRLQTELFLYFYKKDHSIYADRNKQSRTTKFKD